jgi:protein-tyrosine kinase
MGRILQTTEWGRSRGGHASDPHQPDDADGVILHPAVQPEAFRALPASVTPPTWAPVFDLHDQYLRSQRIITHVPTDPRTRAFDMLRTPVLQAMDAKKWRFLAVMSPTSGCGSTVTAANLALSAARNFERHVLLVDLNLAKPVLAQRLGIVPKVGMAALLRGEVSLGDAVLPLRINSTRLEFLPTEMALSESSEWMASLAMANILQTIRREFPSHTVIFDLPALLASDDTLAYLPHADCALLVTAVGQSTAQQIVECKKHLHSTNVVRVVVNKFDG